VLCSQLSWSQCLCNDTQHVFACQGYHIDHIVTRGACLHISPSTINAKAASHNQSSLTSHLQKKPFPNTDTTSSLSIIHGETMYPQPLPLDREILPAIQLHTRAPQPARAPSCRTRPTARQTEGRYTQFISGSAQAPRRTRRQARERLNFAS
jgi:hypothetical protein